MDGLGIETKKPLNKEVNIAPAEEGARRIQRDPAPLSLIQWNCMICLRLGFGIGFTRERETFPEEEIGAITRIILYNLMVSSLTHPCHPLRDAANCFSIRKERGSLSYYRIYLHLQVGTRGF